MELETIVLLGLLAAYVLLSVIVFVMRDKIKEITFGWSGASVKMADQLKSVDQRLRNVSGVRTQGSADGVDQANLRLDASIHHRDVVIRAWSRMTQTVVALAANNGVRWRPSAEWTIQDMARDLQHKGVTTADVVKAIIDLDTVGEAVFTNTKAIPDLESTLLYRDLAFGMVDWLTHNAAVARAAPVRPVEPPPIRRPTSVASSVDRPAHGVPAAALLGLSGSVRGHEFPVDKDRITIGASADNDIVISGDGFVSTHHTCLQYENGGYVIADLGSRNGTFVNGDSIGTTKPSVQFTDRLKIGNTEFEFVRPVKAASNG